ncbi:unnamed protein product, partial [Phaeothamnion confervicola]
MKAVFAGSLQYGAVDLARRLVLAGFELLTVNATATHQALLEAGVEHSDSPDSSAIPALLGSSAGSIGIVVAGLGDFSLGVVDVGTHALVRAAAVQYERVVIVVDPADFAWVSELTSDGAVAISSAQRQALASRAFRATSAVDAQIAAELGKLGKEGVEVLVIGGGGREHAIALALAASRAVSHVYVAPGNGGTAAGNRKISNVELSVRDEAGLVGFASEHGIALVVVGPEDPLVAGISDAMSAAGVPCFGPSAAAARLEASKAYSKDFMARHGIRTARYRNFTDFEAAKKHVEEIDYPVVVKASGLAAGKGVLIPANKAETIDALEQVMVRKEFGDAGSEVVVEEFLEGEEVSVLAFCDGARAVCMPGAQDHKRALDGDKGLNTGGMGAYAPAPCLTPGLRKECAAVVRRTVAAMAQEGTPFVGCLFAGFMLTGTGPVVLEFNVRFGDPETQALLPLLDSDLFEVMMACAEGRLHEGDVRFRDGAAATVVVAAAGYPDRYPKGMSIGGLAMASAEAAVPGAVTVYHAGTRAEAGGVVASGGRVLAVTGVGADLVQALDLAYAGVAKVQMDPAHFRRDIGHRARNAPLRLGVLASGNGTALWPVMDVAARSELNVKVAMVVSNRSKAPVLAAAEARGVPARFGTASLFSRSVFAGDVTDLFADAGVEVVLLVGYMRILSPEFCRRWAGRCINVHPSLLPDFAGGMDLEVHTAVLKAGKTESGCTVHLVTETVDAGPIVEQERVAVSKDDTPETLKAKVQACEGPAFVSALRKFIAAANGVGGPAASTAAKANGAPSGGGVSYKDAGVDIDAGNALVERIKPACKSTVRPGCDADLGGFGGLFDLSAAGFDAADTIL